MSKENVGNETRGALDALITLILREDNLLGDLIKLRTENKKLADDAATNNGALNIMVEGQKNVIEKQRVEIETLQRTVKINGAALVEAREACKRMRESMKQSTADKTIPERPGASHVEVRRVDGGRLAIDTGDRTGIAYANGTVTIVPVIPSHISDERFEREKSGYKLLVRRQLPSRKPHG